MLRTCCGVVIRGSQGQMLVDLCRVTGNTVRSHNGKLAYRERIRCKLKPFCPAHCYFTHCLHLHCFLWANKWWWWSRQLVIWTCYGETGVMDFGLYSSFLASRSHTDARYSSLLAGDVHSCSIKSSPALHFRHLRISTKVENTRATSRQPSEDRVVQVVLALHSAPTN